MDWTTILYGLIPTILTIIAGMLFYKQEKRIKNAEAHNLTTAGKQSEIDIVSSANEAISQMQERMNTMLSEHGVTTSKMLEMQKNNVYAYDQNRTFYEDRIVELEKKYCDKLEYELSKQRDYYENHIKKLSFSYEEKITELSLKIDNLLKNK